MSLLSNIRYKSYELSFKVRLIKYTKKSYLTLLKRQNITSSWIEKDTLVRSG